MVDIDDQWHNTPFDWSVFNIDGDTLVDMETSISPFLCMPPETESTIIEPEDLIYARKLCGDKFTIVRKLNSGAYARVYLAYNNDNVIVVIKITRSSVTGHDITSDFLRECAIINHCEHDNIIAPISLTCGAMVLPLASHTLRQCDAYLTIDEKMVYAEQMCNGLSYLHEHMILHRDIKPENILIVDGVIKIADFGLSVFCRQGDISPLSSNVCTISYKAPELILNSGSNYDYAIDVWAMGVVLWELFTNKRLFKLSSREISHDSNISPRRRERDALMCKMLRKLSNPVKQWPGIVTYKNWGRYASYALNIEYKRSKGQSDYTGVEWIEALRRYPIASLIYMMLDWNPAKRVRGKELVSWWNRNPNSSPNITITPLSLNHKAYTNIETSMSPNDRKHYMKMIKTARRAFGYSVSTQLLAIVYWDRMTTIHKYINLDRNIIAMGVFTLAADIYEDIGYTYNSCMSIFNLGANTTAEEIMQVRRTIVTAFAYKMYEVTAAYFINTTMPANMKNDGISRLEVTRLITKYYSSGQYIGQTPENIARIAWAKLLINVEYTQHHQFTRPLTL